MTASNSLGLSDSSLPPRSFRLEGRLVEPDLNRISGPEDREHVHPKAMEVLVCLAERQGEVVSRDLILETVWSETFVSDQVLANAVWELRRALGDDARSPSFIETVPKRGYRLLPSVEAEAAAGEPGEISEHVSAETPAETQVGRAGIPAAGGLVEDRAGELGGEDVSATRQTATRQTATRQTGTAPGTASREEPRFGPRTLMLAVLAAALLASAAWWWFTGEGGGRPGAQGDEALVVAILPFENNTGEASLDWLSSAVPDVLSHELSSSRHLYVLDSRRLAAAVESVGGGEDAPARRAEIARRRGARAVVSGRITGGVGELRVYSRFDAEGGETRHFEVQARETDELFARLAGRLRLALEVEAADEDASAISATGTSSIDAYRRYIQGVREARALHYREALAELQAAVELDPGFALAHGELAHLYDVLGREALASASIEQAIELASKPGTSRPQAERIGFLRLRARIRGDIGEELGFLRQLVTLRPRDAHWLGILAWFQYTHFRECDEAAVRYRQAIALDPRPHLFLYLGEAAMACDKPQEAMEALQEALELQPESANSWRFLGYLQMLTGDVVSAQRSIARALELAPSSPHAVFARALFLAQLERYEEAFDALRRHRGLQISANEERDGWIAEADLHLRVGDIAAAERAAKRAVELDPDEPAALWIEGLTALASDDFAAAEERLLALESHFADSQSRYGLELLEHLRGKILARRGDWSAAAEAFAAALRGRPLDQARFRLDLADAWLRAGDAEQAAGVLYRLLEVNPNHPEARCLVAEVHERAGRPQAAELEQRACDQLREGLPGP